MYFIFSGGSYIDYSYIVSKEDDASLFEMDFGDIDFIDDDDEDLDGEQNEAPKVEATKMIEITGQSEGQQSDAVVDEQS